MTFSYDFAKFNNRVPMRDFLENLSITDRAKTFAYIEKLVELKNNNILPKENLSKHLEDGIFELRVRLKTNIARCLYYYENQKILFANGFIKKSQKTSKEEIIKAQKIRKENKEL